MRWSKFRGLGAAPELHITPVVDSAQLIRALEARQRKYWLEHAIPPERPDDDDDGDDIT